jgi:chemotaxis protein MotB
MPKKTIIIVKKKAVHAVQHGGAWKVAYADFVTAMMSLFIVLWLMNTSDHVRKAVAGYFNDPLGRSALTGTDRSGSDDNLPVTTKNIDQLKKRLEEAIRQVPDLKAFSNQIEITVTPEGLRIELIESKNGTFFDTGSTEPNQHGRELLTVLAHELGGVPNHLSIEGHTDSLPYADDASYGNWELSADRANSARRLMQQVGLRHDQVSQVRGYADQRLRLPNNPLGNPACSGQNSGDPSVERQGAGSPGRSERECGCGCEQASCGADGPTAGLCGSVASEAASLENA